MTDNECPAESRRRHVLRLALFAGILLGLFYLVAVARVIHVDGVRSAVVVATGPIAPLAYVVVSAALGALFVPGPILAAGSGVLFGPLLDTFVTLPAFSAGAEAGMTPRRCWVSIAPIASMHRSNGADCGRWSVSASSPASRMRWPRTPSGRSEFRCGRWSLGRSSGRRHGCSSTPRWARRSPTCRRRWFTRRSRCGA
ncbi:membrane protein [Mycobacterium tuberculosis M1906]|nr:membrane protein [Mycobacterium tuberculosis M1906]